MLQEEVLEVLEEEVLEVAAGGGAAGEGGGGGWRVPQAAAPLGPGRPPPFPERGCHVVWVSRTLNSSQSIFFRFQLEACVESTYLSLRRCCFRGDLVRVTKDRIVGSRFTMLQWVALGPMPTGVPASTMYKSIVLDLCMLNVWE